MQQMAHKDVCPVCPGAKNVGKERCLSSWIAGWPTVMCITASGLPRGVLLFGALTGRAEESGRCEKDLGELEKESIGGTRNIYGRNIASC